MRYSTEVGGGGATGSGSVARTCLPGRGAGGDGSPQDGPPRRSRRIEHWGIRQKERAIHVCTSDQLDPVPVSLSKREANGDFYRHLRNSSTASRCFSERSSPKVWPVLSMPV